MRLRIVLHGSLLFWILVLLGGCGDPRPTQADLEALFVKEQDWDQNDFSIWKLTLVDTQACWITPQYEAAGITEWWLLVFTIEQRHTPRSIDSDDQGAIDIVRYGNYGAWEMDPFDQLCNLKETDEQGP